MTIADDDDANSDDGDEDGRCLDWQQEVAKTECRLLGSPGRLTDLKHWSIWCCLPHTTWNIGALDVYLIGVV